MEKSRLPSVFVRIRLSRAAEAALVLPVNGQGGFQSTVRAIQGRLNDGHLELALEDVELLVRLATKYRSGGFQERLLEVLGDLVELARALRPLLESNQSTAVE